MFFNAFQIQGVDLAMADLFEEHVGFVYGVMNGVGALAGAGAPLMVGSLTSHAGCTEASDDVPPTAGCDAAWAVVFYIGATFYFAGGLAFVALGGCDKRYRTAPSGAKEKREAACSPLLGKDGNGYADGDDTMIA
jgi:hypothetical protein